MEPNRVAEKNGKAFGTNLVQVEDGYIVHPSYDLALFTQAEIGATGLLKVFELIPKVHGLPGFFGRWDEKANSLDVDITKLAEDAQEMFRAGKPGYAGHHPELLPGPGRRFKVGIRIPSIDVFSGVVSFGLRREMALNATVRTEVRFNAEVIRQSKQKPDVRKKEGNEG